MTITINLFVLVGAWWLGAALGLWLGYLLFKPTPLSPQAQWKQHRGMS